MIVIAIIGTIAAIAIPTMLNSARSANERNAAASLKILLSSESDFRSNDRDGNKVNDYWTGDVAGLYCMTNAARSGNTDPPIKLIDIGVAGADCAPLTAGAAGGEYSAITGFVIQAPKAGYWYYAMVNDLSTNQAYAQNTGGTPATGVVHNLSKFAFMTFPDIFRSSGKRVFIVNENNTILSRELTTAVKSAATSPPGAPLSAYRDWPLDSSLKTSWKAE
jgi:type II secretory pathway pseudopilin PulG